MAGRIAPPADKKKGFGIFWCFLRRRHEFVLELYETMHRADNLRLVCRRCGLEAD